MARTKACLRASVASRAPRALPRTYKQLISDPLPDDLDAKARAYADRLVEAKARYQLVKEELREGGDNTDDHSQDLIDCLQDLRDLQHDDFLFAWWHLPCFFKVERTRHKTSLSGGRTELMTRKLKYGFSADVMVTFKQKYVNGAEKGPISIKVNRR